MSQAYLIVVLVAGLLVAWAGLLRSFGWRAHIAESNYQSNLIRLEEALLGKPAPASLVGSSITGRLLPEYFDQTSLGRIGNLGLDGSGPLLGLELLASRSEVSPVVVIEANLLMVPEGVNDRALRNAVNGLGFKLAGRVPMLRAETRPTSLLYSWLKRRKDAMAGSNLASSEAGTSPVGLSTQEVRLDQNTPAELASHEQRVFELCRRLQSRGLRLILLRFPISSSVVQTEFHPLDFTGRLAEELQILRVDLGKELRNQGHEPRFTDGTHLSPISARLAAGILDGLVKK